MRKNTKNLPAKQERDQDARSIFCNVRTGKYRHIAACEGFEHLGIDANDILIIQETDEPDENQLTAWQNLENWLNDGKRFLLGFVSDNFGDEIMTFGNDEFVTYKKRKEPIYFKGVVVGIVKPYNATKFFKWNETPIQTTETADAEEITVTCDGCEKTMTGSRAFLSGMCWRMRKDSTYCVSCW